MSMQEPSGKGATSPPSMGMTAPAGYMGRTGASEMVPSGADCVSEEPASKKSKLNMQDASEAHCPGAAVCSSCGSPLAKEDSKFCHSCGERLRAATHPVCLGTALDDVAARLQDV